MEVNKNIIIKTINKKNIIEKNKKIKKLINRKKLIIVVEEAKT